MTHKQFVFVYIIFIYFKSVSLLPISVHSESSVLDDNGQHKNLNSYGASSVGGNSGGRYAAGFSQDNEKKHTSAQDSGAYNNVNNDRNSQQNAQQYFGEKAQQENAGSAQQFGRQGGHRKGHRKSGFQKSSHKEESENNQSYYDDSDDQGGHFVYDSRNGGYSSAAADRNQGGRNEGHLYNKGNAQKGIYDQSGIYNKALANNNGYNQNGYYDNNYNQGKINAANAQGGAGRHLEDHQYYQQPQYYPKYEPRRTITIYEDPRDLYSGVGYNNYKGYEQDPGLIHLNFQQNPYLQYPNNFGGYYY